MNKRIELPASIGGYAIRKPGETALDAVTRSIARRLSISAGVRVSFHHSRVDHWTQDRDGKRATETYQMTFVYPKSRHGGGYPVAGEYRITLDV